MAKEKNKVVSMLFHDFKKSPVFRGFFDSELKDGETLVAYQFKDESGKEIATSWIELPIGLNPQQLGSAITYFRRYTLASLLSLELDDDDANEASKVIPKAKATESTIKAMIQAINDGKREEVIKAMDKYSFTPEQALKLKEALNGL